jgi:hypothetical protein
MSDRIDLNTYIRTLLLFIDPQQPKEWIEQTNRANAFLEFASATYQSFTLPSDEDEVPYDEAIYLITRNNQKSAKRLFEEFLAEYPVYVDWLLFGWKQGDPIRRKTCRLLQIFYLDWNEDRRGKNK